jgi:hypothetical protein
MSIPIEKQVAFVQKLLSDTKDNAVQWAGITDPTDMIAVAFPEKPTSEIESENVFYFPIYGSPESDFVLAREISGTVLCSIVHGGVAEPFDEEYDIVQISLSRIFYMVCAKFTDVIDIVDNYLSQGENAVDAEQK